MGARNVSETVGRSAYEALETGNQAMLRIPVHPGYWNIPWTHEFLMRFDD